MEISPITGIIGATINDIDLSRELDASQVMQIEQALTTYKVIVFPEQISVGPKELLTFASYFVTPEMDPDPGLTHPDTVPGVRMTITDGRGFRPEYGVEDSWHTDGSMRETTRWWSFLQAAEVPPFGRDTVFADMGAAYDNLSPPMQNFLDGLVAEHSWGRQNPDAPPVRHPVVLKDDETGRKTLFVNRGYTRSIVGMRPRESQWLLEFLFQQAYAPEVQVRVSWKKGTIAVWNNENTQHYLVQDRIGRRVMHRVMGYALAKKVEKPAPADSTRASHG